MAINNRINIGAAPILWSNVKHAFTIVNDNFSNITLNDLTDVNTEENPLSIGDVLTWTGNQWEPIVSGGVATAAGIGWTVDGEDNQFRISSTFTELNEEYAIRAVRINNDGLLEIEVAVFNPIINIPGQTLEWDVPATGFNVDIDNPSDFTSRYINSVRAISNISGFHDILNDYSTSGPSVVPAGGVDWTQSFTVNGTASILSNGTGLAGGYATAELTFNDNNDNEWEDVAQSNIIWNNAFSTINFNNLSGQNFLGKYNTIDYIVGVFGLSDSNNAVTTLTPTGGILSNNNDSGTMTFDAPLHKDNNFGRGIALSTEFTRPANVTGITYNITDVDDDTTIYANFTYPSFYVWTINNVTPPTTEDIIDGNNFALGVTELGNQIKTLSTFINNNGPPQCFWFAVRSDATQPTVFETGPSATLLSTVSVTTGNTIDLEPDIPEPGYIAEEYTLYGITLQPGDTYVRIN